MLGWVVVTVKLVAVPVELQTTPPDWLKPGSVLHAPEAYVLLSTKYASWAVAALRASAATRALKPRERYAANCGIAMAARMPMIATTTSSSISVKPLDFLVLIFETLLILSPFWLEWVCLSRRLETPVLGSARSKRGATRASATRRRRRGGKGHRFTARASGAEKPGRVHARPAIGTKLTGGGIPSLTPRKAHVARQLQAAPRVCGARGGADGNRVTCLSAG